MNIDRNSLVAVKRPDRNGKMVTRYVKAEGAPTATTKAIPAPRVRAAKPTMASRVDAINQAAGHIKNKDALDRMLSKASKEELDVLDDALKVCAKPAKTSEIAREQDVIKSALQSLARGSAVEDRIVHEMLVLRAAYCSEWSQHNNPSARSGHIRSFIYGLRSGKELPLSPSKWVDGLTASVRFAYELSNRCPNAEFLPVVEREISRDGSYRNTTMALQYRDPEIANFIYQHPNDTAKLIELAVEHRTTEPNELRYLLENDGGAKSLTTGWL
jgi:hypothetical protein